jgi:hypothetical protein
MVAAFRRGAVAAGKTAPVETHAAPLMTALHYLRQWWLATWPKSLGKSLGLPPRARGFGGYQEIAPCSQL